MSEEWSCQQTAKKTEEQCETQLTESCTQHACEQLE